MFEILYQNQIKNVKFINRKSYISSPKTLIIGALGSGKTYVLCEFLEQFKDKERLYLNLKDLRVKKDEILLNLKDFLLQNSEIKAVGIDNINSQNDLKIIKECQQICENFIVTSSNKSLKIDGFATLNLNYLDYEEFIAFSRKNVEPNMLFSHFLAHGGAVKSAFLDINENVQYLQNELKKELSQNELNILKECAMHISSSLSTFEIYKNLKKSIKVSKDSVYSGLNWLESNSFIELVEKFDEPNAIKRVFFTNFALRNALNLKKDFISTFKNAIFCELLKFKDKIFYTKDIDFFLAKRKLAILCIPFTQTEIIFLKFKKLHKHLRELGVSRLQVISVANSAELSIEGIKCEIMPFSRWALGF